MGILTAIVIAFVLYMNIRGFYSIHLRRRIIKDGTFYDATVVKYELDSDLNSISKNVVYFKLIVSFCHDNEELVKPVALYRISNRFSSPYDQVGTFPSPDNQIGKTMGIYYNANHPESVARSSNDEYFFGVLRIVLGWLSLLMYLYFRVTYGMAIA